MESKHEARSSREDSIKYAAYLWSIVALSVVVFLFLIVRVISLGNEIQGLGDRNSRELAALEDSLKRAQADLTTAKELAPGLGEYMTTIQSTRGKTLVCRQGIKLGTGRLRA